MGALLLFVKNNDKALSVLGVYFIKLQLYGIPKTKTLKMIILLGGDRHKDTNNSHNPTISVGIILESDSIEIFTAIMQFSGSAVCIINQTVK